MRAAAMSLAALLVGLPCNGRAGDHGAPPDAVPRWTAATTCTGPFPPGMRLNDLQIVGTHNSYHVAPPTGLYTLFAERARAWQYTHAPLPKQLSDQNIRALELDVHHDPQGGLFRNPLLGHGASALLKQPGFKVFHVPSVDQGTRCVLLKDALAQVAAWSCEHAGHVPILIQLELKESGYEGPGGYRIDPPPPFDAAALDALDAVIRDTIGTDRLITPDLVRGDAATLEAAVTTRGWPELTQAAGRVMIILECGARARTTYLDGRPSAQGRACFINAPVGTPAAAYLVVNDPVGQGGRIKELVRRGYMVRTRADTDLREIRANSTARRDAAFASGANVISTDAPVPCSDLGSAYVCGLPEGGCWRRSPVAPDRGVHGAPPAAAPPAAPAAGP
ncbi:MAG: hypothetical protein KGR22_08540 [Planctomycetes bacterium]|nr:hypothetical protein [Planctomycetota bacterium]